MGVLRTVFRRNTHNSFFKALAGFGRSMNRFYENKNYDSKSNGEEVLLKKLAKLNPRIVFDGGANIGKYSKLLKDQIPAAFIYSFEPVSNTFKKLKDNVANYENIHLVNKGLYKENTSQEINLYLSSTHSSLVDIQGIHYESTGKQRIELVKGDDFIKEHNIDKIDLLKLDLEGAEYDALNGFSEALKTQKIRIVQFEYGYINITTKKLLLDYYKFFEQYGYKVAKLFPKTVEFRNYHFKHEDFLGPNFIAVHKDDTELIKLLETN